MLKHAPLALQKLRCIKPFISHEHGVAFPCGKCLVCRSRRGRQWAHRLSLESLDWSAVSFFTLTYKEVSPFDEPNFFDKSRNFHYSDIQAFNKRFRRLLDSRGYGKIKFFCAGERGERGTHRVHWHILFFGIGVNDEIKMLAKQAWQDYGIIDARQVYNNKGMKKVSAYVSQYVLKKVNDNKDGLMRCSLGIGLKACMRLFRDTLKSQFDKFGEFREIVFDGEVVILDRYLKRKIAESLGIVERLKELALARLREYLVETMSIYSEFTGVEAPSYPEKDDYLFYHQLDKCTEFVNDAWQFRHLAKYELKQREIELRQRLKNRGSFDVNQKYAILLPKFSQRIKNEEI